MTETIQARPECDSCKIKTRRPGKVDSRPHVQHRWYCNNCKATFDDPIERESRGVMGTIPHSGLARKLWDANPEDL